MSLVFIFICVSARLFHSFMFCDDIIVCLFCFVFRGCCIVCVCDVLDVDVTLWLVLIRLVIALCISHYILEMFDCFGYGFYVLFCMLCPPSDCVRLHQIVCAFLFLIRTFLDVGVRMNVCDYVGSCERVCYFPFLMVVG